MFVAFLGGVFCRPVGRSVVRYSVVLLLAMPSWRAFVQCSYMYEENSAPILAVFSLFSFLANAVIILWPVIGSVHLRPRFRF